MVCENGFGGHFFNGEVTDQPGVVSFNIPANSLKEATYLTKIEVLVENRYFAPVTFNLNVKKKMKVVVEAVKPRAKVTETKVSVEKVVPVQNVVESPSAAAQLAPKKSALRERIEQKEKTRLADLDDEAIQKLAESLISGNSED